MWLLAPPRQGPHSGAEAAACPDGTFSHSPANFQKHSPKSAAGKGLCPKQLGDRRGLLLCLNCRVFTPGWGRSSGRAHCVSSLPTRKEKQKLSFAKGSLLGAAYRFCSHLQQLSAMRPSPARDTETGAGATWPAYGGAWVSPEPEPLATAWESQTSRGWGGSWASESSVPKHPCRSVPRFHPGGLPAPPWHFPLLRCPQASLWREVIPG